jgi:phosphodiesterase/alkaline phosphatase D-like protein
MSGRERSMPCGASKELSAGRMVVKKARRSHRPESVQGSSSRPKSAHGVCGGSPQNRRVTWWSHKTKTGGSVGGDGIWAGREALMPADAW